MKARYFVIILVLALVGANLSVLFMGTTSNDSGNNANVSVYPKATHEPIRINGDSDFDSAHGVVSGSGVSWDPYIISGWVIDGSGKGYGIYIGNITDFFIIRNCEIFNVSGGDYSVYFSNSGITLYNVQLPDYTGSPGAGIEESKIYNNTGAGIFIYSSDFHDTEIGGPRGEQGNRIYYNSRAGIYISHTDNITMIRHNMIFSNDVGIHFYYVNENTNIYTSVERNGFANQAHEALRVQYTHYLDIWENVFYKNDGTTGHYEPGTSQATEDYSSADWSKNFWYDFAMNNATNFNTTDMSIPWSYPIGGADGARDSTPMKGVQTNPLLVDWENPSYNAYNDTLSFNVETGVIGGLGTADYPYIISGWAVNGVDGLGNDHGYGLLINNTLYNYNYGRRYIVVDGLVAHNVSSTGSADTTYNGNGVVVNSTGYGYVNMYNLTVYGCANYGLLVEGFTGYANNLNIHSSYIHNNLAGVGFRAVDGYSPYVAMDTSTIDSNAHAGIYIPSISNFRGTYLRVSHNDMGIDVETSAGGSYVKYSSFYANTRWGAHMGTGASGFNVSYSVFYKNNGAGTDYSSSTIQVYSDSTYVYFYSNVYYDWINNNRTNDRNGDDIIDWPYTVDGSANLVDSAPAKWVPFGRAIYIEGDDVNLAPYMGTAYGIAGGSGTTSEPYLIMGWNVSSVKNGAGISVVNSSKYFTLDYLRVSTGSNDGISIKNASGTVIISNSHIVDCYFVGIRLYETPSFGVYHNDISGSWAVAGIEVVDTPGGWGLIHDNRIYRNYAAGGHGIGLYIISYDRSSSGWGLWVYYNQIFGNNNGTYIYDSSNVWIHDNGFAYNDYYGVMLVYSSGNHIYGNVFIRNHHTWNAYAPGYEQAYDDGSNDWNATSGAYLGNYWHDWSLNNDTNDANHDWVVDYPYSIAGGSMKDNNPQVLKSHSPIRIDNVCELTWANGVVGGDGSSSYPYIIGGLRIDGSGAGYGVYAGNISGEIYMELNHIRTNSSSGGDSTNLYFSNTGIILNNMGIYSIKVEYVNSSANGFSGLRAIHTWYLDVEYSRFLNNAGYGIVVKYGNYTTIDSVNVSYTTGLGYAAGIVVSYSDYTWIYDSEIYKNPYGIMLYHSTDGTVRDDIIKENTYYGMYVQASSGFTIYRNHFTGNNGAAEDGTYSSSHVQAYDDESAEYTNYWNTTTEGNCWSDWTSSTPYQMDPSPYVAKDRIPGCGAVPEFSTPMIIMLLGVIFIVLLRRRRSGEI